VTSTGSETLTAGIASPAQAEARDLATADPVEIVDYHPSVFTSLLEMWRQRRLLLVLWWSMAIKTILKYRLGPTWLLLQTFMSIAGFSFIFGGGVFNVKTPNGMPYWLFLMVGMIGWHLFQQALIMSTRSFLRLKAIVRDLDIPLGFVPIAGSAQALLRSGVLLICYIGAAVYYWAFKGHLYAQISPKYVAYTIGGLAMCLGMAWGLGMWTSALMVWARDFRMIVRYVIQFWFFVTPVVYPIENLHGKVRTIAEINPLSSAVELTKVGFLGAGSVRVYAAIWSATLISSVFVSGVWFINRFGAKLAGARDDFMDDADDDDGDLL
jgi:lipopolysaccharide transport system permease protein